jgi:hypothetical protein
MTSIVFVGPTLGPEEVAAAGDFICRPPVSQGDVYRAARNRPRAIGIIDGYFSGAPSVWHKEILWAISEGVPVFGSASMGALRAAELHSFGMRGIGRIFEAFRDGVLEDDDEVAVLHGPAEIGYLAASEPMVNIRETLALAQMKGVLEPGSRRSLENLAKSVFFGERNWPELLAAAASKGIAEAELVALQDWLPEGRVDRKRLDAIEMLAAMQEASKADAPMVPSFHFEWTFLWDQFVARCAGATAVSSLPTQRLLDELRLEGPDAYGRVETRALLRMVAANGIARPAEPSRDENRAALTKLRAKLGLYTRAELDRWMAANDLDPVSLERMIENEARLEELRRRFERSLETTLLEELRLSGAYARLAERAVKKQQVADRTAEARELTSLLGTTLRLWYFENRLGSPMPDDLEDFARRLGFENIEALDAAVHREWLYLNVYSKSP